ncbi:chaperone modulator CbpM [Oceanicella sp. SM1341]|uniref:chaperone modulator CbpM n=1 Tax=Oceanicella sp. SM1341 TaxID=1548889 RepID=UPI000E50C20A|nr:chaperone modulator CbpM [Oceanicella sp. SM1341]
MPTITRRQLCEELHVETARIDVWISAGWIRPVVAEGEGAPRFTAADAARAAFLLSLERDMALDAETMGTMLSLVDQIHGLRAELMRLGRAVEAQPEPVRRQILERYSGPGGR